MKVSKLDLEFTSLHKLIPSIPICLRKEDKPSLFEENEPKEKIENSKCWKKSEKNDKCMVG